jgi:hypothetical protein
MMSFIRQLSVTTSIAQASGSNVGLGCQQSGWYGSHMTDSHVSSGRKPLVLLSFTQTNGDARQSARFVALSRLLAVQKPVHEGLQSTEKLTKNTFNVMTY